MPSSQLSINCLDEEGMNVLDNNTYKNVGHLLDPPLDILYTRITTARDRCKKKKNYYTTSKPKTINNRLPVSNAIM
jgi:hypothetical protein